MSAIVASELVTRAQQLVRSEVCACVYTALARVKAEVEAQQRNELTQAMAQAYALASDGQAEPEFRGEF